MNWNFHILRLAQINEKMQRGEKPSEREIAYVKALWERIKSLLRKFAAMTERAYGMPVSEVAAHLKRESEFRQARVMAERDAVREAMMRMHDQRMRRR